MSRPTGARYIIAYDRPLNVNITLQRCYHMPTFVSLHAGRVGDHDVRTSVPGLQLTTPGSDYTYIHTSSSVQIGAWPCRLQAAGMYVGVC